MINQHRSFDIKRGLVIKDIDKPKVGIFHGVQIPSLEDDGSVYQGSLYIRTNGELYQKSGLLPSSWNIVGSVSGGSGHTHSNQTILDAITDAFTTSDRLTYDSHVASTSNPHNVTLAQLNGVSQAELNSLTLLVNNQAMRGRTLFLYDKRPSGNEG